MISLSDASSLAAEPASVRTFKPWWDICIEYLNIGMIVLTILAWTRVLSSEASGMICVPADPDLLYSTPEARYVSSRCAQEFETKMYIYYPYFLFCQWLAMFTVHKIFVKLPSVVTKLDAFHDIITEMGGLTPSFAKGSTYLPRLMFEGDNARRVRHLRDRLTFLVNDRSYLYRYYTCRIVVMLVLVTAMGGALIIWLGQPDTFRSDFKCVLIGSPEARHFPDMKCSFTSAIFLQWSFVANLVLLVSVLLTSAWALYWMYCTCDFMDKDVFDECKEFYRGLTGSTDLQFLLHILKNNRKDGSYVLEIFKCCIQQPGDSQPATDQAGGVQKTLSFRDECGVVEYIAARLGLSLIDRGHSPGHVYDCFEHIKRKLQWLDLNMVTSMRQRVIEEIQNNPQYFKMLIDRDPDFPTYIEFVERLYGDPVFDGGVYIIMAAANILQVRIVLVATHTSKIAGMVFEAFTNGLVKDTIFLTLVGPSYYSIAEVISNDPIHQLARDSYVADSFFRKRLRHEATLFVTSMEQDSANVEFGEEFTRTSVSLLTAHDITVEHRIQGLQHRRFV